MNLIYIIFFLILVILFLVYIKNNCLIENYENNQDESVTEDNQDESVTEDNQDESVTEDNQNAPMTVNTDSFSMIVRDLNLNPINYVRTCNRDNKMCYYELDKLIKANKDLVLSNSFKLENNKGYTLIISSGEDKLLIDKGLQLDVVVIDDKIECMLRLLK
jgi:hypothetical protein